MIQHSSSEDEAFQLSSGPESMDVVDVLPLAALDRSLAYGVPSRLKDRLRAGSLVRIPIRNRPEMGVVAKLDSEEGVPSGKLKQILDLVHDEPVLNAELLRLAEWMRGYYAAHTEAVLEAMIPAAIRKGAKPKVQRFLAAGRRPDPEEMQALERRAPKQAELLRFLQAQMRPQKRTTLLERLKISSSSADGLIGKGLVVETNQRIERKAYDDPFAAAEAVSERDAFVLTPEQAAAVELVHRDLDTGDFSVRLIHGVTGSGKTEVYLRAVDRVLEEGGAVLFLVPEVALAPQTVGRLRSRLEARGVKTVVWHSHLSEGERYDAWHAVARGEARVVVGARSAVFAPVANLRLIIVDEEHEPSYKQEDAPRYHGRDVAVYRAMLNQCPCLLGSATPALESLQNVANGKYQVARLLKRIDDRKLPMFHVVDMRAEVGRQRGPSPLSSLLADKLKGRFDRKEQSILFLNRRGYAPTVICPDCGHVMMCEHCSVSLTYHRVSDSLRCHLCGHEEPAPQRCPKCGSSKIRWRGIGTQRIEEAVQKLMPRAKVVRMDADAMTKKNLYRKIFSDFRTGAIDVLIGTQMIAKGLDFPNVTLVGLVDADLSLHMPDFRAAERTFQLLVQVSGRAGRGDAEGEVVVQTFTPHSAPIQFARRHDFTGFLDEEMDHRREFDYPPYRHLIRQLFVGRNQEKVTFFAEQFARRVEEVLPRLEIRGPVPAPIEKLQDEYRVQLWYFVDNVSKTIPRLQELRRSFPLEKGLHDILDVDPMRLS